MFYLGFKGLMSKKAVAALAILSVVIGTTGVVTLVDFTQGISNGILAIIESLGPNTILVGAGRGTPLTPATVAVLESLPGVAKVYPVVAGFVTVNIAGQSNSYEVIGVDNLTAFLGTFQLTSGMVYPPATSPFVDIGSTVASPSPGISVTPGQEMILQLNNGRAVQVQVVGVLAPSTGLNLLSNPDTTIFMSLGEASSVLNKTDYSNIILKASNLSAVNEVTDEITAVFGNSLSVITIQSIIQTISSITSGLGVLLVGVASISLVVASVGIMGTLLTKVYQRIREIGIMKTVGMRTGDVLGVFLMEAVTVGVIGGLIGDLLGVLGSFAFSSLVSGGGAGGGSGGGPQGPGGESTGGGVGRGHGGGFNNGSNGGGPPSFKITPVISVETLIIVFVIAIVISLVAGLYPAWRASRLTAVEAIRKD